MSFEGSTTQLDLSNVEGFSNEPLSFEDAYEQYYNDLLLSIKKYPVRDPDSIVQDVFEKALRQNKKEPDVSLQKGWYFTVAYRLAMSELRSSRHKRDLMTEPGAYVFESYPDANINMRFDNVETEQVLAQLDRVFADKPDNWRETVVRYAFRGDTLQEISKDIDCKRGTVGSIFFRAMRIMKSDTEFLQTLGVEASKNGSCNIKQ
ncbi:MAG: RNA polymerase sigma factor [Candidatus Saccharimonadales bacterium]